MDWADERESFGPLEDPAGWRVTWTSNSTITVTPVGRNSQGVVPLQDGAGRSRTVRSAGTYTMVMPGTGSAGTGIGSLHNSYNEAIDTLYKLYWAVASDGTLGVFSVPDGTTVDATLIGALTWAGKTPVGWSQFFWFCPNDHSGNLIEFRPAGPRTLAYADIATKTLLSPGGATVATAVPWVFSGTGAVPLVPATGAKRAWLDAVGSNSAASQRACTIYSDSGATKIVVYAAQACGTAANSVRFTTAHPALALDGLSLATAYYYKWDGAVGAGEGLYLRVAQVEF